VWSAIASSCMRRLRATCNAIRVRRADIAPMHTKSHDDHQTPRSVVVVDPIHPSVVPAVSARAGAETTTPHLPFRRCRSPLILSIQSTRRARADRPIARHTQLSFVSDRLAPHEPTTTMAPPPRRRTCVGARAACVGLRPSHRHRTAPHARARVDRVVNAPARSGSIRCRRPDPDGWRPACPPPRRATRSPIRAPPPVLYCQAIDHAAPPDFNHARARARARARMHISCAHASATYVRRPGRHHYSRAVPAAHSLPAPAVSRLSATTHARAAAGVPPALA
jgi:hypothetical protein